MTYDDLYGVCWLTKGHSGSQVSYHYNVTFRTNQYITDDTTMISSNAYAMTAKKLVKSAENTVFGLPKELFARFFVVSKELSERFLDIVIDDMRYVGYPTQLPARKDGNDDIFFSVVLLVMKPYTAHLDVYKSIVEKLSMALFHEQQRCGYLMTQVRIISGLREEMSQTNGDEWNDAVVEASDLAAHLNHLVLAMNDCGEAIILLNDWITLHFTLANARWYPSMPIRPYQSCVLKVSQSELLHMLPPSSSPLLRAFVQAIEPRKCFGDIATELDISQHVIYRMAAHLVYWKKAILINVMQRQNVYVTANAATDFQDLRVKFTKAFPRSSYTLPEVLSRFSVQKSLAQHLEKQSEHSQKEIVQVLIWALRHDLVVQLHRFIYLIAPEFQEDGDPSVQRSIASSSSSSSRRHNSAMVSDAERLYLENPSSSGTYRSLLKKLVPYFRGHHSVAEIMWRENLSRADISNLVNSYQDVLIECWHELPREAVAHKDSNS